MNQYHMYAAFDRDEHSSVLLLRLSNSLGEELASHRGGGSGGYLEMVVRHAARELGNEELQQVKYKVLR